MEDEKNQTIASNSRCPDDLSGNHNADFFVDGMDIII